MGTINCFDYCNCFYNQSFLDHADAQENYVQAIALVSRVDPSEGLEEDEYCHIKDQIIVLVDRAMKKDPSHLGALALRGKIHMCDRGSPNLEQILYGLEQSIDHFSKVIEREPLFSDAYFPAGEVQYLRGLAYVGKSFLTCKDLNSVDVAFVDAEKGAQDFLSAIALGHEGAGEALRSFYGI